MGRISKRKDARNSKSSNVDQSPDNAPTIDASSAPESSRRGGSADAEAFPVWALVAVPLLAFIVFSNSLHGELFFDDEYAIERNQDVVRPHEVPWTALFENDYWGMPMADDRSHKSFRPLVVLTFRWNYLIDGTNPFGYHFGNVLVHSACSFMLMFVMRAVFHGKVEPAWTAALLFALHPVHCEAVSGVVGRAELMCFMFFLLAVLSGIRGARPHSVGWPWVGLTLALAVAATLSKETGITVLGVLFCYDALYVLKVMEGTSSEGQKRRVIPFVARQMAYAIFGGAFMKWRLGLNRNVLPSWPVMDNPAAAGDDLFLKLLNFPYIYAYNGWLVLFPKDLCGDYTYSSIPMIEDLTDPRNALTLLFLIVIAAIAVTALKTASAPVAMGLVLAGIPFLPSSNIFFTVGFLIAERVLYIPSLGLCVLVATLLASLKKHYPANRQEINAMLGMLCLVYGGRTLLRNEDWRTEESFWASALAIMPGNGKANFNYGNTFFAKADYANAITYFGKSLNITPDDPAIMINMGTSYAKMNQFEPAKALYEQASAHATNLGQFYNWGAILEHEGDYDKAIKVFDMCSRYNREGGRLALYQDDHAMKAVCAMHQGTLLCRQKRSGEGLEAFYRAVEIDPTLAEAWLRIGLEHGIRGPAERAKSVKALERCLELDPGQHLAWNDLARQHSLNGNAKKAISTWKRSISANPGIADTYSQLAMFMFNRGDEKGAQKYFQKCIRLQPEHGDAQGALGVIYLHSNDLDKAEIAFKKAMSADATNPDPAFNYGVLLHHQLRHKEAVASYKKALKLAPQHDAAWSNLGAAYVEMGTLKKAITALRKSLKLKPDKVDTLRNLGLAYMNSGMNEEGISAYAKVTALTPNDAKAHFELASALQQDEQLERALESFENVLELDPEYDGAARRLEELAALL